MERLKRIDQKLSIDIEFLQDKKNRKSSWKKETLVSNSMNAAGIRSLGYLHRNSTGILNVLTQGGRTLNEKYESYIAENILDIDLNSCYANALKDFNYPIGLPTVQSYTVVENCPTLRSFLDEFEDELVDNLYTITISGILSFEQNLLYSKITDHKKLSNKINRLIEDEETIEDLTGDFVVLTNQLENAILTSDILKTLKKICTSNEFKEILDCKVVTAVYSKKSDYIENKEDWIEWMEKNLTADDYSYDLQLQSVVDKRTRKWTIVPFKHFFEPLIEKRKMIKKNIKALQGKNNGGEIVFGIDDEIAKLQGLQEILKLICNTVYGVMASPYFAIGNVVLANNVTGRARVEVWLYSRALNGFMTITDGFQYQPENVFRLKDGIRKPGLRILSDFHKLSKHRGIERISLENLDWSLIFQSENRYHPELDRIDSYAKKHIQTFLGGYNLSMNYDVEHKSENTALKMFYIKRAHYILERRDTKEILYKVRGTSERENPVFLRIAKSTFECIDKKGDFADLFLNDLELETYSI
jgi:DNA polymerase elongation subunit (family B)